MAKARSCVTFRHAWQAAERGAAQVVSTVGCGDASLAGFVAGVAEIGDYKQALRLAVACGGRVRAAGGGGGGVAGGGGGGAGGS